MRLLLEKGADANIKADSGRTVLYQAAENRHEAIAQLLLEKGADASPPPSAVQLLFLSFLAPFYNLICIDISILPKQQPHNRLLRFNFIYIYKIIISVIVFLYKLT